MYLILKKDTILYKGINDKNNRFTLSPIWLSEDEETAKLYGKSIIKYKLIQDIKLLNLADLKFHEHYLNILNLLYTGTNDNGVDEKKLEAAIPLGLPNYYAQITYLNMKRVNIIKLKEWTDTQELYNQFLLNRHRYSTFERDKEMVKLLKDIYGKKSHGYITKIKWPSKLHDGFFNKELCLFDGSGLISIISPSGGKKIKTTKKQKAGEIIEGDTWNRMNHNITKEDMDKLDEKLYKNSNINYILENLDELIPGNNI